ncbi:DMT family transporter [Streptomyces sp. NPDC058284]|uniref:DMT family transporter n=1 Tax=unclassified Streptomyces TaxID=2593676 RepID=UPI003657C932
MSSGPGHRATHVRMAVLALLWGSSFLWIKLALSGGLSPLHLTVVRCALGAGVLLVLARSAGQRMPRDRKVWGHLVVAAFFCNALPFFLFGLGEQSVDSGVAGVLNATTPLWSLAIGLMLRTERRLGPLRLAGLLLGFAGTLLIFAPWQRTGLASWGALVLLAAAVSYAAAFAYMARHLVGRGSAPLALSAAQLLTATGLTTLALPAVPVAASSPTLTGIVAAVLLGTLGTGVTFHLNSRLIADEGPTAAATVGYLLPVVSLVLGALVLGEEIGVRVVVGMAVVLVGVGLTRTGSRTGARTGSRTGIRTGSRTRTRSGWPVFVRRSGVSPAASAPPRGRRSSVRGPASG